MSDFFEIDFLNVETEKSGDAITMRYSVNGETLVHVIDGGYIDTGDQIIAHLDTYYGSTRIDHVVLTHPDQDHANGLRKVLENCEVGNLWMNRPWLYAEEILERFETYTSAAALRSRLKSVYDASAKLEEIAQRKNIPIRSPLQGVQIGAFRVLAPTRARYLDLIVESDKTPQATQDNFLKEGLASLFAGAKALRAMIQAAWGEENFPVSGTSSENEMSVVQYAILNDKTILLTGDAGRDALNEAADFAPQVGLALPGIDRFQVPHHGGRHNVSTEVLDRWLGPRMNLPPDQPTWYATCSSAKADPHHPKKVVIRAMLHRGAHFAATEGRIINTSAGITRQGWTSVPQADYPAEQEE